MTENNIYIKLKEDSGSYWNPSLGFTLVRSTPVKTQKNAIVKQLLTKGVVVEITEKEYNKFVSESKKVESDKDAKNVKDLLSKYNSSIKLAKTSIKDKDYGQALNYAKQAKFILPDKSEAVDLMIVNINKSISEKKDQISEVEKEIKEAKSAIEELVISGVESKIIDRNGAWFKLGEITLGNGMENTIDTLLEDKDLLEKLKLSFDS